MLLAGGRIADASAVLPTPCLAGGGGGIFFFWMLGAVKYLQQQFDMSRVELVGASAGGLVVTVAACGVDPDTAVQAAYRISTEERLFERRLGLLGVWGRLVRRWLEEILPPDAAERCRGRLKLVVTDVLAWKPAYLDDIGTKADLIDCLLCSIHIPFFLDLRAWQHYRGRRYVDGCLANFRSMENGPLLTLDGRSFLLDHRADAQLRCGRLDFVRLRSYEAVKDLVGQGHAYARRTDAAGGFERHFGGVRLPSS